MTNFKIYNNQTLMEKKVCMLSCLSNEFIKIWIWFWIEIKKNFYFSIYFFSVNIIVLLMNYDEH